MGEIHIVKAWALVLIEFWVRSAQAFIFSSGDFGSFKEKVTGAPSDARNIFALFQLKAI